MAIYRGTGGATSVSGDATIEQVLQYSTEAQAAAAAASASQTAAASSASSASTSASNASTSASNAATSESNAATEVTYAAEWADKAEDSLISVAAGGDGSTDYSAKHWAAKAAASYDSFDDRYLGSKASAPTLDNDGNALLEGALYWNSTSKDLWVWNGSSWEQSTLTAGSFLVTGDIGVTVQGYDADTAKLDVAQTYTAKQTFGTAKASVLEEGYATFTSTTNAATVDTSTATVFTHTLTENTTLTFSNPPATGTAYGMTIKIVQDAGASGFTVTWPASVDWAAATAPTLTATASAVDVFTFYTHDGGLNWYGFVAGQAMA